jgi:lactate permease
MITFLALLPFILLLVLMVVLEKPVYISAPITFVATLLVAIFVWQMDTLWMLGSTVRAFSVTLEIMLIIFGAILLLLMLQSSGAFRPIEKMFKLVSHDARIQVIIVAWFFVSFLEGIAGFGTPAMLAAPILIALGFPALLSVVVTLIGDSVAVTFGAVGVPITIGIAEGMGHPFSDTISAVAIGETAALMHVLLSPLIPLALILIVGKSLGAKLKDNLRLWPLALVSGFGFTIPAYLVSRFLVPEFPSIIGALVGGTIVIFLLRKGFFHPKETLSFVKEEIIDESTKSDREEKMLFANVFKSLLPYILIIILLLVTRMPVFGIGQRLKDISFSLPDILGLPASHDLSILYSPGTIFIVVVFLTFFLGHFTLQQFKDSFKASLSKIKMPFIGLFFILLIVQFMMLSDNNASGLASIPMELAEALASAGSSWPLIAPFVGVLGSFISGSSTVSNLLFSSLQSQTAIATNVNIITILALQAGGSAVGNMIAIHNIIAAQSVVGLHGKEGRILRQTLPTVLIYTLLLGLVGMAYIIFSA